MTEEPKKNLADLNCNNTVYITPDSILDPVRNLFGGIIPLDPATEPSNPTKARSYGTNPATFKGALTGNNLGDGLELPWSEFDGTFVNPPYGKEIRAFCEKIHEEAVQGAQIVALLPAGARFATKYFQKFILSEALDAVLFIRGRVKFLRPDGSPTTGSNPYDSALYFYNCELEQVKKEFGHLGRLLYTEVVS